MLKGFGHEVIAAQNGQIALELARVIPRELIVSDILMPVIDCYKLCREWKRDRRALLRSLPGLYKIGLPKSPRKKSRIM